MTRYTYGPVPVVNPAATPGGPVNFDTVAVPVSRTMNGAAETDLQPGVVGTVDTINGTVTPNSAGKAAVTGPDVASPIPLWFGDQMVIPNEFLDEIGIPDGSVTDAKVATDAAIKLSKTADDAAANTGAGRLALTNAERAKLAALNFDPAALVDGTVLQASGGVLTPVDPATAFGYLTADDVPPHMANVLRQASGDPLPTDLGNWPTVVFHPTASPFGFGQYLGGDGASSVTAATGRTFTVTAAAAGERIAVLLLCSGEGTGAEVTYTITDPHGHTYTKGNGQIQGTFGQTAIYGADVVTGWADGASFTIKPNSDRSDLCVIVLKGVGTATGSAAVNQVGAAGGGAVTSLTVPSSGLTTAADTLGLAAIGWNPNNGSFSASVGSLLAGPVQTSTDASPRALAAVYQVNTTTGTKSLGGSLVGTTNTGFSGTGVWLKKAGE